MFASTVLIVVGKAHVSGQLRLQAGRGVGCLLVQCW